MVFQKSKTQERPLKKEKEKNLNYQKTIYKWKSNKKNKFSKNLKQK